MTETPSITLNEIVFDAADLAAESQFWAALLGGTVVSTDDDWHSVKAADGTPIGVQLAPDHVPPQWPDGSPQQAHLDLDVTDIEAAHAHALSVGAKQLTHRSRAGKHGFVVYASPAGHPFCLCW